MELSIAGMAYKRNESLCYLKRATVTKVHMNKRRVSVVFIRVWLLSVLFWVFVCLFGEGCL